jgi:hypothetical protein
MLLTEITDIYCENHNKNTQIHHEKKAEFSMLK